MTREYDFNRLYMDIAFRVAQLSYANKRKVGSIAVADSSILGIGFNHMPSGYPDPCEDHLGNTLPDVVHAEVDMIESSMAVNWNPSTCSNLRIFVTKEPCINCSLMMHKHLFSLCQYPKKKHQLFYRESSNTKPGIGNKFLIEKGIEVIRL